LGVVREEGIGQGLDHGTASQLGAENQQSKEIGKREVKEIEQRGMKRRMGLGERKGRRDVGDCVKLSGKKELKNEFTGDQKREMHIAATATDP